MQYISQPPVALVVSTQTANTDALVLSSSLVLSLLGGAVMWFVRRTLAEIEGRQRKQAERIEALQATDHEILLEISDLKRSMGEKFVSRGDYLQSVTQLSAKVDRVGEHVAEISMELRIRSAYESKS